ncbi:M28 family peptidase [Coriobacterium glomerans]|nr:M28 family peptidase [Coriobacterium glomerans]
MEERAAADEIAKTFRRHGFAPEVQEFSASGSPRIISAVLGVLVFIASVLAGFGGAAGVIGFLLVIAACALFTLERHGRVVLPSIGAGGLSQNVIAHHEASGPMASPRNRPVVVVAHYDSPRADVFAQMPYATYRPLIAKLMPAAMVLPAVFMVMRILPLPAAVKIILWILAILTAGVPLLRAIAILLNRVALPYTSGAVCNKSSVAALLGIMDEVCPYRGEREFPDDIPFDTYIADQRRSSEQQLLAEKPAAVETAPSDGLIPVDGLDSAAANPDAGQGRTGILEQPAAGDAIENSDEPAATSSIPPTVEPAATSSISSTVGTAYQAETSEREPVRTPSAEEPAADTESGEESAASAQPAPADAARTDEQDSAQISAEPKTPSLKDEGNPASDGADDRSSSHAERDAAFAQSAEQPRARHTEPGWRFGPGVVRDLGMIPQACELVYVDEDVKEPDHIDEHPAASSGAPSEEAAAHVPVLETVSAGVEPVRTDIAESSDTDHAELGGSQENGLADHRKESKSSPVPVQEPSVKSGLVGTLSEVGAGAARIFDATIRAGRGLIQGATGDIAAAARDGEPDSDAKARSSESFAERPEGRDEDLSDQGVAKQSEPDGDREPSPSQPLSTPEQLIDDPGATVAHEPSFAEQTPPQDDAHTQMTESGEPKQPIERSNSEQSVSEVASDEASRGVAAADTVDSLMAQISQDTVRTSRRSRRIPAVPLVTGDAAQVVPSAPGWDLPRANPQIAVPAPSAPASVDQATSTNRSSLFDLPDPAISPADPFSPDTGDMSSESDPVVAPTPNVAPAHPEGTSSAGKFEVISVKENSSVVDTDGSPHDTDRRRGLGRLFGRKSREHDSMSDWLGIEKDFDAKKFGRDAGSWDNFDDGDEDWKGGATGEEDASPAEMRNAIASMGDEELLGHDIWFVATGASEFGNAGMRAFLETHRDSLRGVFLINLDCVGAGELAMVATEGEERVLKGDKRIMNLVRKVSAAFHHEFGAVNMPYLSTDAHAAMSMSLRALTIAGVDGPGLARSHSEDDMPCNVDVDNIALVCDVVTEVIRRS